MCAASYHFVISTLRQYQKARLVLNFHDVETHFSKNYRVSILDQGFNRTHSTHVELFYLRIIFRCLENPDKPKFIYSAVCNDSSRYFYFSGTTSLTSSILVSNESFNFVTEFSTESLFEFLPVSEP